MAKKKTQLNLYNELKDVLDEISEELEQQKEEGLNKATDYFVEKLKEATPVDTGETARSWITDKKYRGVKYINNTAVNNQGIPIANLLEFSKKGKPFIRKTFEREKPRIIEIIMEEINK